MMSLWDALRMNMMISYQELVRTFLKARLAEAAQYVPLEQICLSPQCGFASTEEGNALSEDQQWQKVRLVTAIAADVW
ncbi:hypothetical protein SB00610_00758 [Klebsiella quasipneumoniae subsp. similipneumoniae]|nr:hypothetical protein SB00610_00758 [Klebsiella quasipneumoniae subsp. similipneumoniae]